MDLIWNVDFNRHDRHDILCSKRCPMAFEWFTVHTYIIEISYFGYTMLYATTIINSCQRCIHT